MTTLREALARLAEVRRRMIRDYWDGTGPGAQHWAGCSLCGWTWHFGKNEAHQSDYPVKP